MSECGRGDPELTVDTYMSSPSKQARDKKIQFALKLQELVKEEIIILTKRIRSQPDSEEGHKSNPLNIIRKRLQSLVEESEK